MYSQQTIYWLLDNFAMLVNETILVVSTTDHTTWAVSVKTINQRPPNNLHFRFSVSLKRVNLTIHVHSSVPPLTLVDIDHILFQCQELKNRCRISRFRNLFCSLRLKTVMVKFVHSQLFTLINCNGTIFCVWHTLRCCGNLSAMEVRFSKWF